MNEQAPTPQEPTPTPVQRGLNRLANRVQGMGLQERVQGLNLNDRFNTVKGKVEERFGSKLTETLEEVTEELPEIPDLSTEPVTEVIADAGKERAKAALGRGADLLSKAKEVATDKAGVLSTKAKETAGQAKEKVADKIPGTEVVRKAKQAKESVKQVKDSIKETPTRVAEYFTDEELGRRRAVTAGVVGVTAIAATYAAYRFYQKRQEAEAPAEPAPAPVNLMNLSEEDLAARGFNEKKIALVYALSKARKTDTVTDEDVDGFLKADYSTMSEYERDQLKEVRYQLWTEFLDRKIDTDTGYFGKAKRSKIDEVLDPAAERLDKVVNGAINKAVWLKEEPVVKKAEKADDDRTFKDRAKDGAKAVSAKGRKAAKSFKNPDVLGEEPTFVEDKLVELLGFTARKKAEWRGKIAAKAAGVEATDPSEAPTVVIKVPAKLEELNPVDTAIYGVLGPNPSWDAADAYEAKLREKYNIGEPDEDAVTYLRASKALDSYMKRFGQDLPATTDATTAA